MFQHKIDEDLIDRGRRLHGLLENEDFEVFMVELRGRIEQHKDNIDKWEETIDSPAVYLTREIHRFRALRDLRDWLIDEVELGGIELKRKQAYDLRQSDEDPAMLVKSGPIGQPGE